MVLFVAARLRRLGIDLNWVFDPLGLCALQCAEQSILDVLGELRKVAMKDKVKVYAMLPVVITHCLQAGGATALLRVKRCLL